MATAVALQPGLAHQSHWAAPSTPANSLVSLVFSAPLIESVPLHLYLLRSVHKTPDNALFKARSGRHSSFA